jgi:5-hydroxyisourate hydrolase-like protein (transthyretin family)
MILMLRRSLFRLSIIVAGSGLILSSILAGAQQDNANRGRKYKPPPPSARIEVTVLRDATGKPIENASVIFHPMQGERDKGNMELKTNEDGKTIIDVLPIGDTVRLQIIANGFQTFGEDYKIDKAEVAIKIRMKRPGEQYSIYKHAETAGAASKMTEQDETPANGAAATAPTGQANQPAAPSSQSQPSPK